ncbi:hypothetical protein SprV_0902779700 [Sparganum proliferum]
MVCVCGGCHSPDCLVTCELYLPKKTRWYALPNLEEEFPCSVTVELSHVRRLADDRGFKRLKFRRTRQVPACAALELSPWSDHHGT